MSEINKVVRFNMSYQFTPIAQSRARYYSKGSPVQFVRVELLRMEETEDLVATLTFKNVHVDTLTSFTVHFRCKSPDGEIMLEDDFVYDGLNVLEGELFGRRRRGSRQRGAHRQRGGQPHPCGIQHRPQLQPDALREH